MTSSEPRNPTEIWAGDLFGRQEEAQLLTAYLESVVSRPALREDKKAYTVAIDAKYGEGKTFFLKRLAETLAVNHPVAFVDAWADDLADEPLTALAATLKAALEPFNEDPAIQATLKTFLQKSGQVAKIVSVGLLKRGLSLAITGAAVDAAEEVIAGTSEDVAETLNDGVKKATDGAVEDAASGISSVTTSALMEKRIAQFEEGQAAVQAMKRSLTAIVQSLGETAFSPPIIIVIDELDRCRPSYAIKLLEEIKHLFDVPGLVFIIAMHGEQLGHSVAGAYGAGFDGRAYLRRFIDRQYRLATPDLTEFLAHLCQRVGLSASRFVYPYVGLVDGPAEQIGLPALMARYMRMYGLHARDAFQVVDILQTSAALTGSAPLQLAYLAPLIAGSILGLPKDELPKPATPPEWFYKIARDRFGRDFEDVGAGDLARDYQTAGYLSHTELHGRANADTMTIGQKAVYASRAWNADRQPIEAVESYPRLVDTVSRFTSPIAEA